MARPFFPADASLIAHLRKFYSIGQLQIFYCTLTDAGELPGWSDRKRAEYTDGIAQIIGKKISIAMQPEPQLEVEQEVEHEVTPEAPVLFPLEKAKICAKIVADHIEEYCDRLLVAGSIRRLKAEVKDVEIVCQPKRFSSGDFSLFGGNSELKVAPAFKRTVERDLGTVLKGKADGRYMQIRMYSGINLDLFMPAEHDFFRQYAIRTGSRDYSAKVIAAGWKKLGWVGTPDGLRRAVECEETTSGGWKCKHPNPQLPPVWQSEKAFFDWLKVKWVEPKLRTVR